VKLFDAKPKTKYTIQNVEGNRRLFEYGFFVGTPLRVLCFSPKLQSILVHINGGLVALRMDLASLVQVQLLD